MDTIYLYLFILVFLSDAFVDFIQLLIPVVIGRIISKIEAGTFILYAENGNVLAALNSASNKIINEISKKDSGTLLFCERTLIDSAVERGYNLHFYKLSNGQVLSTICRHTYGNYIPIKSIISDDIQSGFEMLNATLQPFDFERTDDFDDFAYSQTDLVDEYQKTLNKKTK